MSAYSFVTRWRVDAPIERVFEVIGDAERWPSWWHGVRSVELLERGDERGIGTLHRYQFRSRLPYSLRFEVLVTEIEQPILLVGISRGELEGSGRWALAADGPRRTVVRYDWNVRTTRWWMNLLSPIAAPIFRWNHDVIMEWGRAGLARRLGVPVAAERP